MRIHPHISPNQLKFMQLNKDECAEVLFGDKIIIQNKGLYRFTSDSILLSRFARAKYGDVVADFCAGSGVVGFHFACLNPNIKSLTLFELQPALCDMARRTAEANGMAAQVVEGRLQDIPAEYAEKFTLILCNPPYERGGPQNMTYERAICRKEITINLEDICRAASKCLKFGGRLNILNRADRLAEMCYTLKKFNLEVKRVQLVKGTPSAKPYLLLAEAVKGGKPGTEVLPEFVNTQANGGGTLNGADGALNGGICGACQGSDISDRVGEADGAGTMPGAEDRKE